MQNCPILNTAVIYRWILTLGDVGTAVNYNGIFIALYDIGISADF
jgi:hypothetical protein